jgi:bifunctional DNA-binding transcriptional regulator/antitoxin component of YhaV-PrlF toxin-antitoxin module
MPTLMRRKLIAMGDGGLVVTVPKAWWGYYGLKAGDEVTIVANGELRISPHDYKNAKVEDKQK